MGKVWVTTWTVWEEDRIGHKKRYPQVLMKEVPPPSIGPDAFTGDSPKRDERF